MKNKSFKVFAWYNVACYRQEGLRNKSVVLEMQLGKKQQQSCFVVVRFTGVILGNVFQIVFVIQFKKMYEKELFITIASQIAKLPSIHIETGFEVLRHTYQILIVLLVLEKALVVRMLNLYKKL